MLHSESAPTPALGLGEPGATAGDWRTVVEPIGAAVHELALSVRDVRRMGAVARLIVQVLGVSARIARKILCTSPTVLAGKVSTETALACYRRFAALDTEVIVSAAAEAVWSTGPSPRRRRVGCNGSWGAQGPSRGWFCGDQAVIRNRLPAGERVPWPSLSSPPLPEI